MDFSKKQHPLVIVADSNYLPQAQTLIYQLSKFANLQIDIYLIIPHMGNPESFSNFHRRAEYLKRVKIIEANLAHYSDLFLSQGHLSSTAYTRLLFTEILPEELDICVYLDVDIFINSNPEELFTMRLTKPLAAVGWGGAKHHSTIASLPLYFNSGVMVLNLSIWRKIKVWEKSKTLLEQLGPFPYADQDVLNIVFGSPDLNWQPLDLSFNVVLEEKWEIDPIIVHFAGSKKPWNYSFGGIYFSKWRKSHEEIFGPTSLQARTRRLLAYLNPNMIYRLRLISHWILNFLKA
jgi:lipopolysaccharide biosynthesis glycosyltransferase